jgi:hypothetical protein
MSSLPPGTREDVRARHTRATHAYCRFEACAGADRKQVPPWKADSLYRYHSTPPRSTRPPGVAGVSSPEHPGEGN